MQKKRKKFGRFDEKTYLCTRKTEIKAISPVPTAHECCCFSSVVERILGKDEVPSSTLGSSSIWWVVLYAPLWVCRTFL